MRQAPAPDRLFALRKGQPLADHSGKTPAKEHQEFRAVACIEVQLGPLAERKQAAWKRWFALDPNQRFCPDQVAGGPKQRMTPLYSVHLDALDPVDRSLEDDWVNDLDTAPIRPKTLVADDQRQCDRVYAEDQGPLLGDDVQQGFDAVRVNGREHGLVD